MLQEISLAGNFITDIGAESIADFLDFASQRLKVLILHWNKISYKGGLKIARSLKIN
jgi:Ran GTPase-activating protein (RanGAP) involved in mRNA processing and transport